MRAEVIIEKIIKALWGQSSLRFEERDLGLAFNESLDGFPAQDLDKGSSSCVGSNPRTDRKVPEKKGPSKRLLISTICQFRFIR